MYPSLMLFLSLPALHDCLQCGLLDTPFTSDLKGVKFAVCNHKPDGSHGDAENGSDLFDSVDVLFWFSHDKCCTHCLLPYKTDYVPLCIKKHLELYHRYRCLSIELPSLNKNSYFSHILATMSYQCDHIGIITVTCYKDCTSR